MPKGGSSRLPGGVENEDDVLENREKAFYYLEGLGTLLWVIGDVSWIFEMEPVFYTFYILAVLGNFAALAYAFLRLKGTVPILPVLAYNLWVIMGCFWALSEVVGSGGRTAEEVIELSGVLLFARAVGVILLVITLWGFMRQVQKTDALSTFTKIFNGNNSLCSWHRVTLFRVSKGTKSLGRPQG